MASVTIAKTVQSNKNLEVNLDVLLRTRLLIQANSGGGKSYCIRRLLETTHGKVQQIVLDLEGEFATLREKFDYLIVGKDGDIPIEVRSAELLAKKILELKVSAIIDLYELKHHERILFVKRFLDAMVNARKELWHPCLVVVDEAHIFCPEKTKSESASAVIDLATRGRKRGFCAVLATQRLSKLHKDAAAECNNKLIGRTGLDVDMKRASEELGFTSKEQMLSLRALDAGNFFAFGPAVSKEIVEVRIIEVETTHAESGMGVALEVAPATSNIKLILSKLVDLSKIADEELREVEDYKKKIRELKFELRKVVPKSTVKYQKVTDPNDILNARRQGFTEAKKHYNVEFNKMRETLRYIKWAAETANRNTRRVLESIKIPDKFSVFDFKKDVMPKSYKSAPQLNKEYGIPSELPIKSPIQLNHIVKPIQNIESGENSLGRCEKAVYSLLYNNPNREFSKTNAALFTGYSHKSGGFNNAISRLNALKLIRKKGNMLIVMHENMQEGMELLGQEVNLFEKFTIENWAQKLPVCSSKIFSLLFENQGQEFSVQEIAERTGYSASSGGFNNGISRLNSLGLIEKNDGMIKLKEEILEE